MADDDIINKPDRQIPQDLQEEADVITRVNRNLLLRFFLTFAKFAYALKATGVFVRHPENAKRFAAAEPDWDSFAVTLRDRFNRDASGELTRACNFFHDSPPNRQVVINDNVDWETRGRDDRVSEVEWLMLMVRAVRNNLFHGSKHNIELHQTTERTEALLKNSLITLKACLEVSPDTGTAYKRAVL